MGVIYLITCKTTGMQYVGQTKHTSRHRWNQHVYEARNPEVSQSRKLNYAIMKYGPDDFVVEDIWTAPPEDIDFYEQLAIDLYGTFTNGYNLTKGGKEQQEVSASTRERIRKAHKGKVQPGVRKRPEDEHLPSYIRKYVSSRAEGYRVGDHPKMNGRSKSFTSSHLSMEEQLAKAKEFLKGVEDGTIVLAPKVDKYGIRRVRHGYEVWTEATRHVVFDDFELTMDQKYQLAKEYAEKIINV